MARGDRRVLKCAVDAGHHHAADLGHVSGDSVEGSRPLVPIEEIARRHAAAGRSCRSFPDHHQPFGLVEWQGTQQRRVHEREHGAVGANAKGQRHRRDARKGWRAPQLPNCERRIAAELLEPMGEPHFTISLSAQRDTGAFDGCDIAKPADGDLASCLRVQAAPDELARSHLDVEGELLVDFLIEWHVSQPRPKGTSHGANRSFETPAENRRQVAVCAASCLRPAGVSRYSFARRPSSDVPHSASTHPRRSMRYRAG
jgi:hypothetical protein